jgi:putative ABC transport system permease protein
MMLNLFKENVRIAAGSIRTQILRTSLTVIIAIGITLGGYSDRGFCPENTISSDFASMGSNTFNVKQYENTTQRQGGEERKIINPIVSYTEAVDFKDEYDYPFTQTSLLTATSNAEVKYARQILKRCYWC